VKEDLLFYPWGNVWELWGTGGYNFAQLPYRDTNTNTDITQARFASPNFGRWFSPDPTGTEAVKLDDPQTWNMYAYTRNNPTTLTDPSGLDFYLQCTDNHHKNCTQVTIGKNQYWVQAGSNGKATIITSDSIRAGANSATVNGNGVVINGGNEGIYFDNPASHTTDANGNDVNHNPIDLTGSGALSGFNFTINGNCSGTCLSSGTWSFNGSLNAARVALYDAGSFTIPFEDVVAGFGGGAHAFSTQHRFGGPGCSFLSCPDSPHLSVPYDPTGTLEPKNSVPATGGFHVDAHADWLGHFKDVTQQ
jgi:RHS repeat-associated protein